MMCLDLQLQEQLRRQRHYQLKLFKKYEMTKNINNGIENQTINKLSKYHEKSI